MKVLTKTKLKDADFSHKSFFASSIVNFRSFSPAIGQVPEKHLIRVIKGQLFIIIFLFIYISQRKISEQKFV